MDAGLRVFDLVVLLAHADDAIGDPPPMGRLRALGLADRTVVIRADRRLVERRLVHAALHRAAFAHAYETGAQCPLVVEEGCLLHADANSLAAPAARALVTSAWRVVSLGGAHAPGALAPATPDGALVAGVHEGSFANGYRREALAAFLDVMPPDAPRLADWIAREESIDAFLARAEGRVLVDPRVATIAHLLPYEDPDLREGFVR